ncbi:hypothetical protein ACG2F4_18675 [Halalkalibaculum sp. DA3122]|uniref:hypothetical protein n=1 Tax=unclassified Halalkalibaculum TaxID=2964617 RepID=UPI003754D86B
MKNILVTGVGGPTPRSFVRAVKLSTEETAASYRFVGVDCDRLAYGLYDRTLFDAGYTVPRADDESYWSSINDIIERENIHAAVVLPEAEVLEWARNRSRLSRDVLTHLPDYTLAMALVNKHRLHEYLTDSPLIPRYRKIDPSSYSYQAVAEQIGEVFWIRSTEGSSGLGSLKIESAPALDQWISINQGVDEFIATEYLPGRNMACKMLYFDGELKRTACAERVNYIMAKVAPSGITGNTAFGRLINEPGLIRRSRKALESISEELETGLNGIFTVDYKEDADGQPKITEINIRHVAFTSSIAAGGANIPADTLDAMFSNNGSGMKRIDYRYEEPLVFLRDVDSEPIVMRETDLLDSSE